MDCHTHRWTPGDDLGIVVKNKSLEPERLSLNLSSLMILSQITDFCTLVSLSKK